MKVWRHRLDLFFVSQGFTNMNNQGTQIHSAGADQSTFAAKHAFLHFFFQSFALIPTIEVVDATYVEAAELPGRTSRCAGSATDARSEGRHFFFQSLQAIDIHIVGVYRLRF